LKNLDQKALKSLLFYIGEDGSLDSFIQPLLLQYHCQFTQQTFLQIDRNKQENFPPKSTIPNSTIQHFFDWFQFRKKFGKNESKWNKKWLIFHYTSLNLIWKQTIKARLFVLICIKFSNILWVFRAFWVGVRFMALQSKVLRIFSFFLFVCLFVCSSIVRNFLFLFL
jgi:hypothetical protein